MKEEPFESSDSQQTRKGVANVHRTSKSEDRLKQLEKMVTQMPDFYFICINTNTNTIFFFLETRIKKWQGVSGVALSGVYELPLTTSLYWHWQFSHQLLVIKTFYWTSDKNCLSVWILEGVHISKGFIFEFYICVQTENLPFFVLVFWICIFILYSCSNRKTYIQNMKKIMRETKMVVVAKHE